MNTYRERFLSLDIFRGMTICFMIIVNTPGSGAIPFAPLEHATWHGFTPTDLVFPSFLFAVGNAMSFSLDRYKLLGNAALVRKILKRTILIFLLGYLMYWFPFFRLDSAGHVVAAPISNTRIFGVLQRIALCYCFASLMIHYMRRRTVVVVSILLLIVYWILLLAFGNHSQPFSLLGNAGLYLDKALLGTHHMYHGESIPFDPEGILSTLPAIVNVVIGYFAGKFIQQNGKGFNSIAKLMLVGSAFIFIALCWHPTFPINKKLWTSSFVLLTTGLDLVLISALIYILEIQSWNYTKWTNFFQVFGKNPLFIYLLSEVLVISMFMIRVGPGNLYSWINNHIFQNIARGALGSLLFALCYMMVCWLVGLVLSRKNIYIRV
ncbi:MAG: acyltransferase family protein [Flavisolibacter sp.]